MGKYIYYKIVVLILLKSESNDVLIVLNIYDI